MNSVGNPSARVVYVCGGRSFFAATLSRKLAEVPQCWRQLSHEVAQVCGGDVQFGIQAGTSPLLLPTASGATGWQKRLPEALVVSLSEYRDIRHDRIVLEHLRSRFRDWRPEIIWERSSRLHSAGLLFAREIGVPYVLEWKDHLVDYDFSLFRQRALTIEAKKNREADHIVVESNVLCEALVREGLERQKIIVAHNAVCASEFKRDIALRNAKRVDLGVPPDTILVGYLGSYAFYHDAVRLVLAADIIRRENRGARIQVLMLGAGRDADLCRRRAKELGLLDQGLMMRPSIPSRDVPGILSALDIAVLPGSTDIICPIKVQEYMASELPSVMPDYPCNREVVTDGENGVLFKPGDEQALAEAILRLASDPDLRARIGAAGRKVIEERFSWAATWGAALQTVIHREAATRPGRNSIAGVNL